MAAKLIEDIRLRPLSIQWTGDGRIGRIRIDDEYWAAVEWSEKQQRRCIEDAEGRCLSHRAHVHGGDVDKAAAVALAEAMIRDGRMPSPAEAKAARRARTEKRRNQPAQLRKARAREQRHELNSAAYRAEWHDRAEPPLYEALADVFDFTDPQLWRSNAFAALRPRLILHTRAVTARLEADLVWRISETGKEQTSQKLDRAREILRALEAE